MNVLLNFNPEMTQKFNHRIVLKQYTVNELVEMQENLQENASMKSVMMRCWNFI